MSLCVASMLFSSVAKESEEGVLDLGGVKVGWDGVGV